MTRLRRACSPISTAKPLADPRPVRFAPGRRLKSVGKECHRDRPFVRLPRAARIHQHPPHPDRHSSAAGDVPGGGFSAADIDEYNRQARTEYEDVRDFIIAHYKVTRRSGDPFWDHVREMDVPDSLAERLELFRSSGRFFKHNAQELFAEESWVQVLLGQGFEMHADPVTNFVSR